MNQSINDEIRRSRIMKWEIAAKIGITESTFSRCFRRALTEEQAEKIRTAIAEIQREENA